MERNFNIAEILKDKPKGTKLYADAFGELSIEEICTEDDHGITLSDTGGTDWLFYNDGKYSWRGESILVPSKEMRDWNKFAWKKGDVLVSNDSDSHIIFKGFSKDDYTTFEGKHWISVSKKRRISYLDMQETQGYHIEDKDAAQTYINAIEERLGGKLNRETLEIEKKPEFKDGDILFVKCEERDFIEIFNYSKKNGDLYDHASLDSSTHNLDISGKYRICKDEITEIRLATDYEKQQLFSALEKKGKAWDAEKKQIVDLKPKCEFKPFDKVLGRNEKDAVWEAELFSHYKEESQYPFRCIGFSRKYCIPYNEETAHLLGTTDDWKGGEQ